MADKKTEAALADELSEDDEGKARREFLKKSLKGAAIAPAVTLLLAAGHKPASADNGGSSSGGCG